MRPRSATSPALEEIDVDREPARAQAFLVKSMPTVVLELRTSR